MSNKLDHEARNREERANRQGREFVEAEQLSDRQKEQLREGAERHRKAARRREEEHKRSLAANLTPVSLKQAAAQLQGLIGMLATVPSTDVQRRASMLKDIKRLEAQLGPASQKKLK